MPISCKRGNKISEFHKNSENVLKLWPLASKEGTLRHFEQYIIILIIFINCNWVVTRLQWLFYMYIQNTKLVTNKFKSGGLHEKHVVATWNVGNHLSICL